MIDQNFYFKNKQKAMKKKSCLTPSLFFPSWSFIFHLHCSLGCTNSVGQAVEHGQKWIHATDVCQVCSCEEGITKCERMECDVPCTHPVMKPNHCCPECNGNNLFIYL